MQVLRDDDERVIMWDSMRDKVYGPREVREKLAVPETEGPNPIACHGEP